MRSTTKTFKFIAGVVTALSLSMASLVGTSVQASATTFNPDCLRISGGLLQDASSCTGNIVIPDNVSDISPGAFIGAQGNVFFGLDSQVRRLMDPIFMDATLSMVVLPPDLEMIDSLAFMYADISYVVFQGETDPYFIYSISNFMNQDAVFIHSAGDEVWPQSGSEFFGHLTLASHQVDCSSLTGNKTLISDSAFALQLFNCMDPDDANTEFPSGSFYVMESQSSPITLQSRPNLSPSVSAVYSLATGPTFTPPLAVNTHVLNQPTLAIDLFGAGVSNPSNVSGSFVSTPGTSLPSGVTLTAAGGLEAASTAGMQTSVTYVYASWIHENGVSNSVDVAQNGAEPLFATNYEYTLSTTLNLLTVADSARFEQYKTQLATASASDEDADWDATIDSYRLLPDALRSQVSGASGVLAQVAVDGVAAGTATYSSAVGAIDAFAAASPSGVRHLSALRANLAKALVINYEQRGGAANNANRAVADLPASDLKTELLARLSQRSRNLNGTFFDHTDYTATYTFKNPYAVEKFVVPTDVTRLTLTIAGAEASQGGPDVGDRPAASGFKGQVTGVIDVTPGQVLTIGIGEPGQDSPYGNQGRGGVAAGVTDPARAFGGLNPLGGYAGGDGGSPGNSGFSGYGGAGGAATVVQLGTNSNPSAFGVIVAGGAGASGGSSQYVIGTIGQSTFSARTDATSTDGQDGLNLNEHCALQNVGRCDGGGAAGGGGGVQGGAMGAFNPSSEEFYGTGAAPGQNTTGSIAGLTASYVAYTFAVGASKSGIVTITYDHKFVDSLAAFVPASPIAVAAVGGPESATVSWSAPSEIRGTEIVEYRVLSSDGQVCFTKALSCKFTGLTPGSKVSFTVVAVNSYGSGIFSPSSELVVVGKPSKPNAPSEVDAKLNGGSALVSWTAPPIDGGSPITGFVVSTSHGKTCTSIEKSCLLTGLKPGELFDVSVVAQNVAGESNPALLGKKVFVPLSLNLGSVKTAKSLTAVQLAKLTSLTEDPDVFKVVISLASNKSNYSSKQIAKLLSQQIQKTKLQLAKFAPLSKVSITGRVVKSAKPIKLPSAVVVISK